METLKGYIEDVKLKVIDHIVAMVKVKNEQNMEVIPYAVATIGTDDKPTFNILMPAEEWELAEIFASFKVPLAEVCPEPVVIAAIYPRGDFYVIEFDTAIDRECVPVNMQTLEVLRHEENFEFVTNLMPSNRKVLV